MPVHNKVAYLEFFSPDLPATKAFFRDAFGWEFVDYGPDYTAFAGQGVDGGFQTGDRIRTASEGAPLVILYSSDLEGSVETVVGAGGRILKPIFSFPGGRRFHFAEPGGNELAVWSDQE